MTAAAASRRRVAADTLATPLMVVFAMLLVSGCGADTVTSGRAPSPSPAGTSSSGVPAEFQPACGKPGSEVVTQRLRVVIRRKDCDLTGVVIVNQGRGVTVPPSGGVSGPGVTVDVTAATRDVTFTAEAEVGNQ